MGIAGNADNSAAAPIQVRYRRKAVDGLAIFFREAGDPVIPPSFFYMDSRPRRICFETSSRNSLAAIT
jgi:hypothetical protein